MESRWHIIYYSNIAQDISKKKRGPHNVLWYMRARGRGGRYLTPRIYTWPRRGGRVVGHPAARPAGRRRGRAYRPRTYMGVKCMSRIYIFFYNFPKKKKPIFFSPYFFYFSIFFPPAYFLFFYISSPPAPPQRTAGLFNMGSITYATYNFSVTLVLAPFACATCVVEFWIFDELTATDAFPVMPITKCLLQVLIKSMAIETWRALHGIPLLSLSVLPLLKFLGLLHGTGGEIFRPLAIFVADGSWLFSHWHAHPA